MKDERGKNLSKHDSGTMNEPMGSFCLKCSVGRIYIFTKIDTELLSDTAREHLRHSMLPLVRI